MVFLINCSNLKNGGGLQVAYSICSQLGKYEQHFFVLVLSSFMNEFDISKVRNCKIYYYDIKDNLPNIFWGRDKFLDGLVENHNVNAVLTVFGPSRWRPKCKHLCGFARAQLLLESPYTKKLTWKDVILYKIWEWGFKKSSDTFYTENRYISEKLPNLLGNVNVYTVTNYYNHIFDQPDKWLYTIKLPKYEGITCLSISTYSNYKNFEIIEGIIKYLFKHHPSFRVRFVLTFDENEMRVSEIVKKNLLFVGKKSIFEVPYLYEQCDIMFMPTLLECFTATYPEAMRMEKPIVTTDLEFARGLCGDAACYYSAVDPQAAAEAIFKVATDKEYAQQLVKNGNRQLLKYDNYEQRADKLIHILEQIAIKEIKE